MNNILQLIFLILFASSYTYARLDEITEKKTKCIFLKSNVIRNDTESPEVDEVECDPPLVYCHTFWSNDSQGITVKSQGCFSNSNCEGKKTCVGYEVRNKSWFCCCEGDFCNSNFYYDSTVTPSPAIEDEEPEDFSPISWIVKVILLCICFVTLIVVILYRKRCIKQTSRDLVNGSPVQPTTSYTETLFPVELVERKAKGRFGAVWKAKMKNEIVAVKVVAEKNSWKTEQEVFTLPFMDHDNILKFIRAEQHGDNWQPEYWLITAYHEIGSLSNYLRENTVTLEQLCFISLTMARGLAHLHDEIRSVKGDIYKPTIAHRDFKSSNVLLKSDLSACIADFGLALTFRTQTCGFSHSQVGTPKYMAPELLEGVINFSCSSFLRIDIYACGLVMWEILTRCKTQKKLEEEYRLPYEAELGEHPSVETLRQFVVVERRRPLLKPEWKEDTYLSNICTIIEESWDADTGARISAACVTERFLWYLRSIANNETKLLYNIS